MLGILASLTGATAIAAADADNTRYAVNHRATLAQQALGGEVQRYVDTMRLIANAVGTQTELTRDAYRQLTHPLHDLDLVGASGVSFVVPASDDQVDEVQALWRTRGVPDLTLQPDGTGREHFFSIFSRQLDGSAEHATGLDLAQVGEPAAAFAEARRGGGATLSRPYHLLRDRNLPISQQQLSFVLAVPVLGPFDDSGQRPFRGWLAVGLRGQDFTAAILRNTTQGLRAASLYTVGSDGREIRVAALNDDSDTDADLSREVTIRAVQQRWTLRADFLPIGNGDLPAWVAISGCLLAIALAGIVLTLATARDRARAQVVRATERLSADIAARRGVEAALRQTRDALADQRTYLGGLLDALDVAVIACDTDGTITHENAYSRRLRGDSDGLFNLTRLDGTPLTHDELPLVRTLREESVDVEVMQHAADRRPLAMLTNGRTLYSATGERIGAVVTAYDITALREHERELSGFAGVAAHDLKSPLAVIAAYTEILSDDADGKAGELLGRIDAGVKRMRSLIDDLLAYSTARDAPLDAIDIDLRQLFADVVAARTDHLRLTAGGPFPDVYIGPLPAIHADRAMVRQLIDNLVGNALKYVQPGTAARIDVTAATEDSWVRVEVADRGIGIPEAARNDVFTPFHRLRTEHTYGGTGLGLAICQRIVERHGGRIAVAENAGGGSRFTLTLPQSLAYVSPSRVDLGLMVGDTPDLSAHSS